ncbi:hypothetical protein SHIRM173S_13192 [Streptomyces hirsutus]
MAAAHHRAYRPAQERTEPVRHREPDHLPLHRTYRRQHLRRDPREPPAEAAPGEHHLPGAQRGAVGGDHARGPLPGDGEPLGPRPAQYHSRPLAGGHQRGRQTPGVDLVVAVHPQPAAHTRCEHRLQTSALPPGQPLRVEPRLLLQDVQFAQMGAVVGVQRDRERAAAAVAEVMAGGLGELGREVGVAARGGEVQTEQGLLAVVQFRDGGQHPCGHLGGAGARLGVQHGRGQSALRGPPGRDQADDPAPDDEDVRRASRSVRGA